MNNIAINESPELASEHVEDFRAPRILPGAIVTDQNREDAAMEYEKRSLLRKLNPNAVTAAELMRSKSRKVVIENKAALQAYPQQDVLQAIQGLEAQIGVRMEKELRNLEARMGVRTDSLATGLRNLEARIDDLATDLRTRSSNIVTVRSQNLLPLSFAVLNMSVLIIVFACPTASLQSCLPGFYAFSQDRDPSGS
jgi:hypothetical protein